jgi:hypothetical protein
VYLPRFFPLSLRYAEQTDASADNELRRWRRQKTSQR